MTGGFQNSRATIRNSTTQNSTTQNSTTQKLATQKLAAQDSTPQGSAICTPKNSVQPKAFVDSRHTSIEALKTLVCQRQIGDAERQRLSHEIGQQVLADSKVMRDPNFQRTTTNDLRNMAELYDSLFFDGHCLKLARAHGMQFRWSKRMTSNGGKTVRTVHLNRLARTQSTRYEIALSSTLLFQTFSDLQRPIRVTGLLCTNRLQAMQRILEHELIHLVEMLVWEESCCAAVRFQSIAQNLFGHTEHKHDLITQQERASRKFNLRVGSRVHFQLEGRRLTGTINRITRRATILVTDPQGQLYDDGKRYRKYYVPLSHLELAAHFH